MTQGLTLRYDVVYIGAAILPMGTCSHHDSWTWLTTVARIIALLLGRPVFFKDSDALVSPSEPLP